MSDNFLLKPEDIIRYSENDSLHGTKIKLAYNNWLFSINTLKIYNEQLEMLEELKRVMDIRYELGEIDLLTRKKIETRLGKCNMEQKSIQYDILIYSNILKHAFNEGSDPVPLTDTLIRYQSFDVLNIMNNMDLNEYTSDPDMILQLENSMLNLKKKGEKLMFYEDKLLVDKKLELYLSNIMLSHEDIDFTKHYENVSEFFNIKIDYLNILREYNNTVIKFEEFILTQDDIKVNN